MRLSFVTILVAIVAALGIALIAALWRRKKAGTGNVNLLGETARVVSLLNPEGTVLVFGELWRAKSNSGHFIQPHARVRIVGFQGHLLLVEVCD
ncbi:MAG TPA: hypothetical protein DHU55_12130 [Blastocatellia bacterium]|jgi:membrane-bound ClpP family serine protease|nr:hypothetical protein [Blastocatellia bacterium]HAF24119.1 hypothetical protein [Blastocatellia bacterium]HCX30495.1 hypothetical protein [Blastocatellia bacterium]